MIHCQFCRLWHQWLPLHLLSELITSGTGHALRWRMSEDNHSSRLCSTNHVWHGKPRMWQRVLACHSSAQLVLFISHWPIVLLVRATHQCWSSLDTFLVVLFFWEQDFSMSNPVGSTVHTCHPSYLHGDPQQWHLTIECYDTCYSQVLPLNERRLSKRWLGHTGPIK